MRRWASLALGAAFVFAGSARAAEELPQALREQGVSLRLPAEWTLQRGAYDNLLIAQPDQTRDPEGWSRDLLTIQREKIDPRRTCLDGYTQRRLRALEPLLAPFRLIGETPTDAGPRAATLLEMEGTDGPRVLRRYWLAVAEPGAMVNVTLSSEPARFEQQRARFRAIIESVRTR